MPVDVLVDEQVARYRWFRGEVTVGDFFDRWCASDNLSRPKTVYEHSWEIRDLALAEISVRAGQAAFSYSLWIPPRRCLLRMLRWAIWFGSVIAKGGGFKGRAVAMPW
ncbi:hypothetical protein [Actinomadura nitritigenes]|uniref:hypothetical protein n=1 Tax=Actinomadura nitritigenes TaxID=134602 RepID=UPI001FB748E3|nr:hypothetical protein [Actinomadura nitritigenes]